MSPSARQGQLFKQQIWTLLKQRTECVSSRDLAFQDDMVSSFQIARQRSVVELQSSDDGKATAAEPAQAAVPSIPLPVHPSPCLLYTSPSPRD